MLGLSGLDFLSLELLRYAPQLPYHMITLIIMVMPISGYLDTVRLMLQSQSADAYNFQTVMIINSAQGLKILYYIFHPYAIALLGQAVFLILAATVMTYVRFKYVDPKTLHGSVYNITKAGSFTGYIAILTWYSVAITVMFIALFPVFGKKQVAESIGLISTLLESSVSVPTFYVVVILSEIKSVSKILILQYLFGDMMKVGLFIALRAPFVFLAGAFCQLTLDVILFCKFVKLLMQEESINDDGQALLGNEEEDIELQE